jgi:hypothetical protein
LEFTWHGATPFEDCTCVIWLSGTFQELTLFLSVGPVLLIREQKVKVEYHEVKSDLSSIGDKQSCVEYIGLFYIEDGVQRV